MEPEEDGSWQLDAGTDPPFLGSDLSGSSAPFVPSFRRNRSSTDRARPDDPQTLSDLRSIMTEVGLDQEHEPIPVRSTGPSAGVIGVIGRGRKSAPGPEPPERAEAAAGGLIGLSGRSSVYEGLGLPGLPIGLADSTRASWATGVIDDTAGSPSLTPVVSAPEPLDDDMEKEMMDLLAEESPQPVADKPPVAPKSVDSDTARSSAASDRPPSQGSDRRGSTSTVEKERRTSVVSLGSDKTAERRSSVRDESDSAPRRYKTKQCINWQKTGKCSYGGRCQFAHGSVELRQSVDSDTSSVSGQERPSCGSCESDRPRVCWNWANTGSCKFGDKCTYASSHTTDNFGAEVSIPICRFWSSKGHCPYGSKCNSASTHRPENMPPEGKRESFEGRRSSKHSERSGGADTRSRGSEQEQLSEEEILQLMDDSDKQSSKASELFKAAGFGSIARVQGLLDMQVDPNIGVVHGRTALMQAASWGHTECVQALIDARADPCAKDPGGKTALFLARVHDQQPCIQPIQEELTELLAAACTEGVPDRIRQLVDSGAEPNICKEGRYPLGLAAARSDAESVCGRAGGRASIRQVSALLRVRSSSNAKLKLDVADLQTGQCLDERHCLTGTQV